MKLYHSHRGVCMMEFSNRSIDAVTFTSCTVRANESATNQFLLS